MGILPIILFLLGVVFLLLGWRWQSSPSQEAMTALKGLAYLKREIIRVQDQVHVHVLEDKVEKTKQIELREIELKELKIREHELKETELKGKNNLYVLNAKDQGVSSGGAGPQRIISPKYQEVLELAAQGQRIPEIAQRLLLSQDAVRMVLQTQPKGEIL